MRLSSFMPGGLIVPALLSQVLAAAGVTFTGNGAVGTSFMGKELKSLGAVAQLPKKLGTLKFDRVRVVMKLSHLDVLATITYDRAELPAAWAQSSALKLELVKADGGSDFEGYGLKDFTTVPQRRKLEEVSAEIKVLLQQKTGVKEETRWDESREAWVKTKIPIFDAGTSISSGTVRVSLERLAGEQDKHGVISVAFPDAAWMARVADTHIGSGTRTLHSIIQCQKDADETLPVNVWVRIFAFNLGDWPELKDKGWAGLKASVAEEFLKEDKKVDFGWGYLIEEKSQPKAGATLSWAPATVAGQPGLVALHANRPPLYLTVRPPYVIAAIPEHAAEYHDKRTGKTGPLPPEQAAQVKQALEGLIAAIQPLKGEAPAGNWVAPVK